MNARSDGLPKSNANLIGYGISYRKRRKPYIVKFKRNKKHIYVGSYFNIIEAQLAAERYLRNER